MIIEEIITIALDLAGGELIKKTLSRNLATLYCLNVIDTMMLELANSSKAIKGLKESITLAANTNTGELPQSSLVLQDFFICYRENDSELLFLNVLDDIEDLKRAEVEGKRAILFTGFAPRSYYLSWKPAAAISCEMWGKSIGQEITDLNGLPPFPKEFGLYCAYRIADFTLNQLLAIDAKLWQPFVIAQKTSIKDEKKRLDHIWDVYRSSPASANTFDQVDEYDWRKDYADMDGGFYLIGRRS